MLSTSTYGCISGLPKALQPHRHQHFASRIGPRPLRESWWPRLRLTVGARPGVAAQWAVHRGRCTAHVAVRIATNFSVECTARQGSDLAYSTWSSSPTYAASPTPPANDASIASIGCWPKLPQAERSSALCLRPNNRIPSSSTLLSWVLSVACGADSDPVREEPLESVQQGVEGQACPDAFRLVIRSQVRNTCAAVTRVAWWCHPVQLRPSKWSRPTPVFSSR